MLFLWASVTEEVGGLADGHPRPHAHVACGEPGVFVSDHELCEVLRSRVRAGFLLVRELAKECAEARGLPLDDYLAEKGRNLALLAAENFG